MILRLWTTCVDPSQMSDYQRFEIEHSLPMFRRPAGFSACFFSGLSPDEARGRWRHVVRIAPD